jgi:nickel-dependent lactate racemase
MTALHLPWAAWYGDTWHGLAVPDAWRVTVANARKVKPLSAERLRETFDRPIGTDRIRALAHGKRSVVIVVDDLTRPTPTATILPLVLEELAAARIQPSAVQVLVGMATHRPLGRHELLKKLGPLADDLTILSHNPYDNLVFMGTTSAGTPLWINRRYVGADLRLTIGCVEPHPAYGFSGGAKLVFPGLAGIESIYANHRPGHLGRGILAPGGNPMRQDAEEAVRMVGLEAIVNTVITPRREVAGLFVGDFIAAHRAAAEFAESVYATPVSAPADVVVCNAYPKDTELIQVNNAVNVLTAARTSVVRPNGPVVITTAASEGAGWHGLANPGSRMYERPSLPVLAEHPVFVYCPHGREADLPPSLPAGSRLFRDWSAVVAAVERAVGPAPVVTVFPEGTLQIPGLAVEGSAEPSDMRGVRA